MRTLLLLLIGCFQMTAGQSPISKTNAEHYTWGQGCDGWYLVKNDQMNIIEERMPPGTAEILHKHAQARQFFYVLTGAAVLEHDGVLTTMAAGTGMEIAPGVAHRILNQSKSDLEILVTSQPPSHGDRIEVK